MSEMLALHSYYSSHHSIQLTDSSLILQSHLFNSKFNFLNLLQTRGFILA